MIGKQDPVPQTPIHKDPPKHGGEALVDKPAVKEAEPKARADDLLRRVISTMGDPRRIIEHQAAIAESQAFLRAQAGA